MKISVPLRIMLLPEGTVSYDQQSRDFKWVDNRSFSLSASSGAYPAKLHTIRSTDSLTFGGIEQSVGHNERWWLCDLGRIRRVCRSRGRTGKVVSTSRNPGLSADQGIISASLAVDFATHLFGRPCLVGEFNFGSPLPSGAPPLGRSHLRWTPDVWSHQNEKPGRIGVRPLFARNRLWTLTRVSRYPKNKSKLENLRPGDVAFPVAKGRDLERDIN